MLPWIFGVLVLLNLAAFLWGQQRGAPLDLPLSPVPAGRYEIRLRAEPEESAAGGVSEPAASLPEPSGPSAGFAAQDPPVAIEAAVVDPKNPPEADAIVLETDAPEADGAGAEPESAERGEGAFGPVSQGSADAGEPVPAESPAEAAPDR